MNIRPFQIAIPQNELDFLHMIDPLGTLNGDKL